MLSLLPEIPQKWIGNFFSCAIAAAISNYLVCERKNKKKKVTTSKLREILHGVKIEFILTNFEQTEISYLGEVGQVEPNKTTDIPSQPISRNKERELKLVIMVNRACAVS